MLRWRLVGAAAIILPVLLLLWMDDQHNAGQPGIWFAPLLLAFSILCCLEMALLFRHAVASLDVRLVALSALMAMTIPTVARFWHPLSRPELSPWSWAWIGMALSVGMMTLVEMSRFRAGQGATLRLALMLLTVVYLVIPYNFLIALRMHFPSRLGLLAFVSVVYTAKFADAGAYFVGRYLGSHPMAPILSPKKTWEGAVGGLLAAIIATWFYFRWLVPWLYPAVADVSIGRVVGFATSIAIAGLLGDLSVSLLKRDVGQKDSAKLLPGLGGGLDILDSVLWAAPVGYLWWSAGALVG